MRKHPRSRSQEARGHLRVLPDATVPAGGVPRIQHVSGVSIEPRWEDTREEAPAMKPELNIHEERDFQLVPTQKLRLYKSQISTGSR